MKKILKKIFKSLSLNLSNKNVWQMVFLYLRWYGHDRYKIVKDVNVLDFKIDVPDIASFLGQFRELFVDDNYKFTSGSNEPLIYDCGANIGLSCLYFKKLYIKYWFKLAGSKYRPQPCHSDEYPINKDLFKACQSSETNYFYKQSYTN